MKVFSFLSPVFFILLAINPACAAWYYDVIMDGDIRVAFFTGWNGADCGNVHAHALTNHKIPQDYSDSHAEFMMQPCIKGGNDFKEFKGNKEMAEKEIKYLEKLFVDRIPMLKAN